jgi:hypothetical protein
MYWSLMNEHMHIQCKPLRVKIILYWCSEYIQSNCFDGKNVLRNSLHGFFKCEKVIVLSKVLDSAP